MDCRVCGHLNREEANFCGNCGAALAEVVACPACGAENPPGQRFCDSCGGALSGAGSAGPGSQAAPEPPAHLAEKIRAGRAELEGERKHVTVLFADVVGSTDLAEQVDPELWRQVMERLFATLCAGVHRFEGKAYLTGQTAALVEGYLVLTDLGEHQIKGVTQAMRVYEQSGVGAARGRLDISRARGLTRLVGREEELAVLEAALERREGLALAQTRNQPMYVVLATVSLARVLLHTGDREQTGRGRARARVRAGADAPARCGRA